MKKATCLLLSQLMFCQFAICNDVPEHLRGIYGDVNPCNEVILNSSLDDIKAMDERTYSYYKMQTEKCENYKQALIQVEQTETIKNAPKGTWNFIGGVIITGAVMFLYLLLVASYS